jgi:beta-1,4-mannooligosaccharide/beta-1,4-mannosyl-N-acetylglucosamine phosphorylase
MNKMIKRCTLNPILTEKDIPYNAALIFNAGAIKIDGKYYMLFRNDYAETRGSHKLVGTNLGLARSDDGIHWIADPNPCFQLSTEEIVRIYDPRLQVIEGEIYLCFAVDTKHGIRGGIAKTDKEFKTLDILIMAFTSRFYGVIGTLHFDGSVDAGADTTCCCHGGSYA